MSGLPQVHAHEPWNKPCDETCPGYPESPPYCRHLMTVEAAPADDMDPDGSGYKFLSRCICGTDITAGPWPGLLECMQAHLLDAGLLETAAEVVLRDRGEHPICPKKGHKGNWPRGAPGLDRYTDGSGRWSCPGLALDGSACGYEQGP